MEGGLLNCLLHLQHTLRNLCFTFTHSSSSTSSSKWVYAVFWKISPRNYPPPKWDYGGNALDRSKKKKRNWILVWEDGFCDFDECERAGSRERFGADVFFKMSHEVYSFGEGLVGNVAADNSHKWIFSDSPAENNRNLLSSWNAPIDTQPRAWKLQFHSGIQTIAVVSVREGLIQLGSFEKIDEDLNLVINIQRKFSNLLSLHGFYAIQRPFHKYNKEMNFGLDETPQITGCKRVFEEKSDEFPLKSLSLGYNSPHWHIPPLFPSMPCSFGALLSSSPFEGASKNAEKNAGKREKLNFDVKTEPFCVIGLEEKEGGDKPNGLNSQLELSEELK